MQRWRSNNIGHFSVLLSNCIGNCTQQFNEVSPQQFADIVQQAVYFITCPQWLIISKGY